MGWDVELRVQRERERGAEKGVNVQNIAVLKAKVVEGGVHETDLGWDGGISWCVQRKRSRTHL